MKTMTGGTEDAGGKKKINAQACLKWAWKNEHITTAIPGFSNYDELDECLVAARSPELTAGDQEYLATPLRTGDAVLPAMRKMPGAMS